MYFIQAISLQKILKPIFLKVYLASCLNTLSQIIQKMSIFCSLTGSSNEINFRDPNLPKTCQLFSQKVPSQMFDYALNKLLYSIIKNKLKKTETFTKNLTNSTTATLISLRNCLKYLYKPFYNIIPKTNIAIEISRYY